MTKVDLWKSFIQEQNNNASMTKGQSSLQVAAKGKQEWKKKPWKTGKTSIQHSLGGSSTETEQ